ncbi:MAG TPA: flagellar basal body rod protein FlgC [Chloroflexota bacterium]|nr:flagellar basal body rod protein FlgC [Chloroflexota bacterium]
MTALSVLRIAGSGLTAQRLRMDVTASNIANAEATRTADGGPYRRESVVFTPRQATGGFRLLSTNAFGRAATTQGVQVAAIVQDPTPPREVLDPLHPDADAEGYVAYPNVDLVTEMTDMLSASRAYEANVTMINVAKNMAQRALDIGRL